ncbi:Eukaryotic initiation factor 4A [Rhynchospora pubera]|uniref:Eukaryotic initiation factor 4A n=1 Tax=Rhynchospora pubera TaxID=906938 RepID=A0AAV8C7F1_9POAL|nr:Eukaryotic initiation factor 4A [Rhynchospora pubera]
MHQLVLKFCSCQSKSEYSGFLTEKFSHERRKFTGSLRFLPFPILSCSFLQPQLPRPPLLPGRRSPPVQNELAGKQPSLPIVICCSSRDELDAVCCAVANLSFISFSPLYSDQAETERASILEKFRLETLQWNQKYSAFSLDGIEPESNSQKSCVVVATDACLPSSALGEASLTARLLINYELPTKKETYFRRTSSCLAADGIVINMVVGGEVAALRALEEAIGLIITEMPISMSEIL